MVEGEVQQAFNFGFVYATDINCIRGKTAFLQEINLEKEKLPIESLGEIIETTLRYAKDAYAHAEELELKYLGEKEKHSALEWETKCFKKEHEELCRYYANPINGQGRIVRFFDFFRRAM